MKAWLFTTDIDGKDLRHIKSSYSVQRQDARVCKLHIVNNPVAHKDVYCVIMKYKLGCG